MSKSRWLTPEQIARVRQLQAAGMYHHIIAARLGLDRSNVSRLLRKFGVRRARRSERQAAA